MRTECHSSGNKKQLSLGRRSTTHGCLFVRFERFERFECLGDRFTVFDTPGNRKQPFFLIQSSQCRFAEPRNMKSNDS